MKKTVLIVEDDENIAQAEKLILQQHYTVHIAKDGAEGVEMAKKIVPDVVVLDIMMPKLSGIDVCRHIRKDPALCDVKVVMVTAKDQQIDELKGLDAGADDYIVKPFEPDELRHVVHQVLNE